MLFLEKFYIVSGVSLHLHNRLPSNGFGCLLITEIYCVLYSTSEIHLCQCDVVSLHQKFDQIHIESSTFLSFSIFVLNYNEKTSF